MSDPPPPSPSTESNNNAAPTPLEDRNLVRELVAEVVDLRRRLDYFRQEQELMLGPIRAALPYQDGLSNRVACPSSFPPIPSVPPPLLPSAAEGGRATTSEEQYIDFILKERERYQTRIDQLEWQCAQLRSEQRPFIATSLNRHHAFGTGQGGNFVHGGPRTTSMYPPSMILAPPPTAIGSGPPFSRSVRDEYEASLVWARGGPSITSSAMLHQADTSETSRADLRRGRNPDVDGRESQLSGQHRSIGNEVPPVGALGGHDHLPTCGLPPMFPASHRLYSVSRPSPYLQFTSVGLTERNHYLSGNHDFASAAPPRTPLTTVVSIGPDETMMTTRGGRCPNLVTRGASSDSESTVLIVENNSSPVQPEEKKISTSAKTKATMIPQESSDVQSKNQSTNQSHLSRDTSSPSTDEQSDSLLTTKRKLPIDFIPSPETVVLGKGNGPKVNPGNLKLKGLIVEHLDDYINGERREKIAIISSLVRRVNATNPVAGFVRNEDDKWYEVTDRDARVKVTAIFRDCLHDKYRSSSNSKVKRRKLLRGVCSEVGESNSNQSTDDERE